MWLFLKTNNPIYKFYNPKYKTRGQFKYFKNIIKMIFLGKGKWKSLSRVQLFEIPWIIVHGILQVRILEWVA